VAEGPAAYSLYDVLRTLVERTSWPSEEEKRLAIASVDQAERARVFGDMAAMLACPHEEEARTLGGRCDDCGKQVDPPRSKTSRSGELQYGTLPPGYLPGIDRTKRPQGGYW